MLIYDFTKNLLQISVFMCLIALVCIVCLIQLIVWTKNAFKNKEIVQIVALLLAIIILIPIIFGASFYAFITTRGVFTYYSGNYKFVSGQLEILTIERNDSRYEELYYMSFTIGDVLFENAVNGFSKKLKDTLSAIDKNVEIRYSYLNRKVMIYQIFVLTDE